MKILIPALILPSLFSNFILAITNFDFFRYLDELILVLALLSTINSLFKSNRQASVLSFKLLIVLCFMILISLTHFYMSFDKIVFQSIIHLKFFFFFLFFNKYLDTKIITRTIKIVLVISVIGAIVNIINVNNFNAFFNLKTIERSLITRINGFQLNSNNLGLTLALGFILVVRDQIILFKLKYLSVLLVLILIVLTGSRSAYLLVLFYIIYSLWTSKVKYYRFFLIFSSIFVGVLLLETIYNSDFYKITERNITDTTSGASSTGGYIRGVIISNGFKLASDNFPFGTGAASYGSVLSENSPVYKELGLSNKLFFQDMTGIYDSNFATIIGEFGLFGIFLFLFLFSQLKKMIEVEKKRGINFIFFIIIFLSITQPVLMNSYQVIIIVLFFILYFKKGGSKDYKITNYNQ